MLRLQCDLLGLRQLNSGDSFEIALLGLRYLQIERGIAVPLRHDQTVLALRHADVLIGLVALHFADGIERDRRLIAVAAGAFQSLFELRVETVVSRH